MHSTHDDAGWQAAPGIAAPTANPTSDTASVSYSGLLPGVPPPLAAPPASNHDPRA